MEVFRTQLYGSFLTVITCFWFDVLLSTPHSDCLATATVLTKDLRPTKPVLASDFPSNQLYSSFKVFQLYFKNFKYFSLEVSPTVVVKVLYTVLSDAFEMSTRHYNYLIIYQNQLQLKTSYNSI